MKICAFLGRRDYPTDVLEDYCTYLSEALRKRGLDLHLVRMPWAEMGWAKAMLWFYRQSREWQNQWILMQYTALAWSMWEFPTNFLWGALAPPPTLQASRHSFPRCQRLSWGAPC